jgi:preprotein translocase subunit YajC
MTPKQKGMLAVIVFVIIILLPVTVALIREQKYKQQKRELNKILRRDTVVVH